jgi:hypothetical protein
MMSAALEIMKVIHDAESTTADAASAPAKIKRWPLRGDSGSSSGEGAGLRVYVGPRVSGWVCESPQQDVPHNQRATHIHTCPAY